MTRLRIAFAFCFSLLCYSGIAQPNLWGITPFGGATGNGTIFNYKDNTLTSHYSFGALQTGESPWYEKLVQATNGKIYGMTQNGGTNDGGVIYEFDPTTKAYTVMHVFDDIVGSNGTGPIGGLIQASNGKLYGVAFGGGGILFEFDIATKSYSLVHNFVYQTGYAPGNYLVEGDNHTLVGVTALGGAHEGGVIFEFDFITKEYKSKFDFSYDTGITPRSGLIRASSGKFYGMTEKGGRDDKGILYEYDQSSNQLIVKRSFGTNNDGAYVEGGNPYSLLVEHPNGKFYAATPRGGTWGAGVLFEYDLPSNTITKKIEFSPLGFGGGSSPVGGLTMGSNGVLYGMTKSDEVYSTFRSDFYEFNPATGLYKTDIVYTPSTRCTLLQASDGKLYGVSEFSGYNSKGELFSIDPQAPVYNAIFSFDQSPDGANPYGHLTQAYNGKFYGMTHVGGMSYNGGVIFEFDPTSNVYTKKIDLTGLEQFKPNGGFTLHPNGKLYGMITHAGKIYTMGSVIEFDPETGTITHSLGFDEAGGEISSQTFGQYPLGDLLLAPNGKMYALVSEGGTNGIGTLIEYDPINHTLVKKFDFNASIGKNPKGSLTLAANGKLYGTTSEGGANYFGTLFEYDIALNEVTKKADFTASTGVNPEGWMTLANNNKLYGLSKEGGPGGVGAGLIYQYDPATATLDAVNYFLLSEGFRPRSSFIALPDGKLYGFTRYGGTHAMGTLIAFDPTTNEVTDLHSFNGLDGAYPEYNSLTTIKKVQTVTLTTTTLQKVYGDAPVNLSVAGSSSSALPLQIWSADPGIAEVVDGMLMVKGAGTTDIIITQLGNSEFLPAQSKTIQLVVSKATLQVAAPQLSKVYGESLPDIVLEYDGFVGTDGIGNLDVAPVITCSATAESNAGAYPITVVTGDDDNYVFTIVNGSLEITPAEQTITFEPFDEKTFGDAPFDLTAESSSGLNVVYHSSNTEVATISGKTATIVGAGEVQITASQPGNTNYFAAPDVVQTLKINELILGLESRAQKDISIHPIPTTGKLFIERTNGNHDGEIQIQIVDLIGRVVMETNVNGNESIDISSLTPGFYLLKYSSGVVRIEKL